jgi:hypothetical protein
VRQDCVKEILSNLAKDVKEELRKNPFFLVTEHDLEGFIYSRLFMNKEIHEPFYDQQQRPNFKLHAEYPRYRKLYPEHQKYSGKSKGIGSNRMRYDIAILRQTLQDDDPLFRSKYFSERKVEIGF